ncbi:MAG: alpha-2-macroglobulin family protein [Chitinophagaceae bacterium]|nr:alpha-2-macroglobulin family protein [Chitinophagaceae bacterium]
MRSKTLLAPILIGTFFLCACKTNNVSLDFTNAKGEVPLLGNLVFRFNQALATDTMLNAWDSTDYVKFEPRIPGRFRWESPDQLVFSPSQPLSPATSYTAEIRGAVLRFSKYDDVKGGDKVSFHTPPLTLDNSQVIWMSEGESSTTALPQLDLYFNYRINPADLKEKLEIEIGGKKADFNLVTLSPDNKISLRIINLAREDKDYEAKVTINKGLKPESGKNATSEPITASLTIPSPYILSIQGLASEHDGAEGVVHITTSQQLAAENVKALVKFEPELPFTYEVADDGFILRSDKFDIEKSYSLTITKGLRGKIGGVLKENYYESIVFGELEANIRFSNSKAVYLSGKGSKNIEVKITNVPKIKLVISKIYENNLLMTQRYGYYPQETQARYASYEEDGEGEYYEEDRGVGQLGDVIYEKEIDTRTLPKSAGGRILNFSQFEDRLADTKGIYHVMIRSEKDYWVKDSRYISLSDLGLVAKEGQDKIFVFANSIKSAEGVSGVNVTIYASNNQLLGTGATNRDGVAEIAYSKKEFGGFKPAMVIAKTADDFNYLPFNNTRVNTSRFDVSGKRNNPSGLDAYVYAERDIYRPGEKINFSVILRDREWKTPGTIPLKMKVLMPNGKELKSFRKSLNEEGSLEGSVDIAPAAITGGYTLEVYTSNDVLLASKSFSVEEFVPDRIRVNVKLDKKSLRPGETSMLAINAVNFFGPPAANRNYETEIQVRQKVFSPDQFSGYDFTLANQNSFFDKVVKEGKTDAEGNASFEYAVPTTYNNMGALQTNFYATVFDETGRPVSRATSVDIFTQDVFFGIKYDAYYYSPLNQPVQFQLAAAGRDGQPVNSTARIEVIKHEYKTMLVKGASYFRYESQKDDKLMIENEVMVKGKTSYSYIPRSPGDYELRIYRPGASSYVSRKFYSYGSWGGNNNSFEVNNEGNIEITLNKKSYFTGEKVTAHFKTPFSGRLLVTLETDHVISYRYVDVKNRDASLDLEMEDEHVPNVYITATLIKPHEVSDIPLTVAHGFQNVKVEEKTRKIPVKIESASTVRSKTRQKVLVKAAAGSFVTLSAVDNGVLQISSFETPDPYQYFYQKKALQVNAYDMYPLLFAEVRGRLSSSGGDADLEMAKRVNPMPAKRIKVVSYWSGIVKANGDGEANFEFEVPQFSGELRLMAVAYKGHCFGAAASAMTVADPVVISTALPRFLSPGDTVNVPVTLTNTTDKSSTLTASVLTTGAVRVIGGNSQSISVNGKTEGRATFKVVANSAMGTGQVKITVNGMGEKFEDVTDIGVRPPSGLQKLAGSGSIQGGSTSRINIGLGDFIPGTVDYQLVVSRSPVVEFGEQLRYLVQYPYGCTEQTVSAAFPQIYYGDLADAMQLNNQNKLNANTNILEAIRKIKMRQLYNGSVTMWDGEGTEDWWVTIYSAHFLLEARKAGFDVDNSLLETMLNYVNNRLKNKETILYYYNRTQTKKIAPKEVAYGLYVLALAGRTNIPAMNYYKANQALLALDSRYLLSAAYASAGDKKSFASMLPASFSGEESVTQTGGSYYSDVRDEAIALNALLSVDPGNGQIPTMAKHVADKLKSRRYLNTQERAFSFLALGKLARAANNSTATAEIRVGGKSVAKVDGGQWRGDKSALKGTDIEIVTNGSGRLYYYWTAEGVSSTGAYKEEDSYLKVRKQFYSRNGEVLSSGIFKQNDLIIVGITLERSFSTPIENVVITDLLPAGFEIENPRTKEIPGMDWIKDGATPTALDVRDDRIHFFVDAIANKQTYYYAVRAVSPGQYKMGPVGADAMYNGEYHSYHGAGIVKVVN